MGAHRIKRNKLIFVLWNFNFYHLLIALKNRAPRKSILVDTDYPSLFRKKLWVLSLLQGFFSLWFLFYHHLLGSRDPLFQVTGPGIFMLRRGWPGSFSAKDDAFVPDQMFCFSLVTVCIVVPYYPAFSGTGARVASESAKSSAESMRQLAASLGREHFYLFDSCSLR